MSKGSKKKPGPAPKSEQRAKAEPVPGDEATSKAEQQSAAELEACFMKALEKRMGGLEMTEDNVRKVLLAMSPEEQRALAEEGEALKRELLQNEEHADEAKKFRAEVNKNAEARGLPTEADGEHLTKGVLAFLNAEGDEASGPVPTLRLLLMLASSPYLAKLALADAAAGGQTGEAPPGRAGEARAEPADIDALEQALAGLEVDGFAPDQRAGRPPFVRRNLTLLCGHLHRERLPESLVLRDSTKRAQGAAAGRASKLSEMLFRYALQNRWVKPALAATEVQALLTNGLWDGSEAAKRRMAERMAEAGLKLPRLKMAVSATDARPGRKVTRAGCRAAQCPGRLRAAHRPPHAADDDVRVFVRRARDTRRVQGDGALPLDGLRRGGRAQEGHLQGPPRHLCQAARAGRHRKGRGGGGGGEGARAEGRAAAAARGGGAAAADRRRLSGLPSEDCSVWHGV
ncbi:hypothetical protein EMIHUDRAFT_434513 [Emiliania huxleyi CCMP1516]|uniref:Uncharacterized protein n=2 Tax=Emiliania huxleyi TaxID=2903 RepID=A0A0D3K2R4_EMIH1|nr:hypothetical protein EMIHUDRAFT_434513 [Emiliania huxleyi CCMP1516]EOD30049.1 hypothetical protein EMIHUDRAFT_434513 [Emiliania huxleyi CCMP1516]|eukprot:XP_005782478.1 hypothetical protein EMIHUDRAFT_434513 [Emiliania huxleyi CCMP1516]